MKESDKKEIKVKRISLLLGLDYDNSAPNPLKRTNTKPRQLRQPKQLSEMALKIIHSSLKKKDLNIIYAEYLWAIEYEEWYKEMLTLLFLCQRMTIFIFLHIASQENNGKSAA